MIQARCTIVKFVTHGFPATRNTNSPAGGSWFVFLAPVHPCCSRRLSAFCYASKPPRRHTAQHAAKNAAGLGPTCFFVFVFRCVPAPGFSALFVTLRLFATHGFPATRVRNSRRAAWFLALAPVHPCCSRRLGRYLTTFPSYRPEVEMMISSPG